MTETDRSALEWAALGCGIVLLAGGSYLPWSRPNPSLAGQQDSIPDILLPRMNAGIDAYSLVLLAAIALVLVVLLTDRRHRRDDGDDYHRRSLDAGVLFAGLVAVAVPIQYLLSTSLVGFDRVFVPTLGWYLALCGGFVLAVIGVVQVTTAARRSDTTAAPNGD